MMQSAKEERKYRIKYWYQETLESGRWCYSGVMTLKEAKKISSPGGHGIYERPLIVHDEIDFPPYDATKEQKHEQ